MGHGPYPDFERLRQPCIERGILETTSFGEATLSLARLRALADLYADHLEKNPDLLYSTSQTDPGGPARP